MTREKPSLGYNPLDPRDRAERGRERAAWFRRSDMMGAVTLAMAVFVALAIWRKELALAYLLAAMFVPILISTGLILTNAAARRTGRREPVSARPGPVLLVALSSGLFLAVADPFSLPGAAGGLVALVVVWVIVRRQKAGGAVDG